MNKDTNISTTTPAQAPASSLAGSLYRLGRHLLICGDSTNTAVLKRLASSRRADLLITDPPYNVDYKGAAGKIANDRLRAAAFLSFLSSAFAAADSIMRPGAAFYIWHSSVESFNFHAACRAAGWRVRETLGWVKPSLVLGRLDYHYRHEPCLYGWKDGATRSWYSDRRQTTVLDFVKPVSSPDHPTMKPVALFQYLISNSSKPGDIVLDPFAGSGTTVIACERLGRSALVAEIDPHFCDVIRRRWAEFVHGEGCDWTALPPAFEAPPPSRFRRLRPVQFSRARSRVYLIAA